MGEALSKFITVRYEEGRAAAAPVIARFRVSAFPTLLVLDGAGGELLEVHGGDAPSLVALLERARSGDRTLPALRAAVREKPKDPQVVLALAEYLSDRYADEAVPLCERIVKGAEKDAEHLPRALFIQGYAESNRGRFENALALFDRLVDTFPKAEATRMAILTATNFLSQLAPERGLAFLRKALPLVPGEERRGLEYTRGYLYLQAAKAEWLRRAREAGDDAEWLNNIAWECFQNNWHTKEAIGWARKAVELSGRAPHILDTLANLLAREGDLDEAIRLEEEAVSKCEEEPMRAEFEENLAKFKAVRDVRAARKANEGEGR